MQARTLNTKALDNFGYAYDVVLLPSDYKGFEKEYLLRILGTGASWFMSTLANHTEPRISIDLGQKWDCVNFWAVLAEARSILAEIPSVG